MTRAEREHGSGHGDDSDSDCAWSWRCFACLLFGLAALACYAQPRWYWIDRFGGWHTTDRDPIAITGGGVAAEHVFWDERKSGPMPGVKYP